MKKKKKKSEVVRGWHFLPKDMRLNHDDGRKVEVGKTLSVRGKLIPCAHGLHFSERLLNALTYADRLDLERGHRVLCYVEAEGELIKKLGEVTFYGEYMPAKICARHRKVLYVLNRAQTERITSALISDGVFPQYGMYDPETSQYAEDLALAEKAGLKVA